MALYGEGRAKGGFEPGIEAALRGILVDPEFLFHIERDPANVGPATVYRLSDIELASRLSFFLWSSIPDEELLGLAERGTLHDAAILDQQVARMLKDRAVERARQEFLRPVAAAPQRPLASARSGGVSRFRRKPARRHAA